MTSLRNVVASVRVKRRSAARTSSSSPRPGAGDRGSGGSARVVIASVDLRGQVVEQEGDRLVHACVATTW